MCETLNSESHYIFNPQDSQTQEAIHDKELKHVMQSVSHSSQNCVKAQDQLSLLDHKSKFSKVEGNNKEIVRGFIRDSKDYVQD